jgi:hypothetical protein
MANEIVDLHDDDEVHKIMEEWDSMDWISVAKDGNKLCSQLLDMEVESESPMSNINHGVAAQAQYGVFKAIGVMLGINHDYLRLVVSDWLEDKDNKSQITYKELLLEIQKVDENFRINKKV